MPKIPSLKPRQVIAVLSKAGFVQRESSGSHFIFRHPDTRKIVVVPVHGGKDIKKGTLRNIIRQTGIPVDAFLDLL